MERWLQKIQMRWLDRVQSRLVLPTARTLYVIGAGLCVLLAVLGLAAAVIFQVGTWQQAHQSPVPEVVAQGPAQFAYDRVERRLAPPSNVRVVVDENALPAELSEGTAIGHLEADTPNQVAAYPDGFQIIGGKDAELFATGGGYGGQTLIRAQAELSNQIKAAASQGQSVSRTYNLRVLARDRFGNRAAPAEVNFSLPHGAAAPAAAPTQQEDNGPAALRAIALQIARIQDPARSSPEYFQAYNAAMAEPVRCGAPGDDRFMTGYRADLDFALPKLNKDNIQPFFAGVCEAWSDALAKGVQANEQAIANRARILSDNAERQAKAEFARAASKAFRNLALMVVASAVLAFMVVALFLAFLAIEGHSSAVRQVVELLASREKLGSSPPKEAAE